jgi:predicted methyltransferase
MSVRFAPLLAILAAVAAAPTAAPAAARSAFPNAARAPAPSFQEDASLKTDIDGAWRSPVDRARDAYRHPYESLTFWGLQPGMTIVDVQPGGGWWTEILAPYAAQTGSHYLYAYAPAGPASDAKARERQAASRQRFAEKFSDPRFGKIGDIDFTSSEDVAAHKQSVDFLLVARIFHDWAPTDGETDRYLAAFFSVLKPGGILAVEQHRAPEGADPKAGTGWVPESYVIEAAKKAGFVLEAKSEINANPRDTRDYPFGVWTLPPTRQSAKDGHEDPSFDHARYDRIGESDRMTLRFRKP